MLPPRSRNLARSLFSAGRPAEAVAAAGLLWVVWPTLAATAERWRNDPQYSHGYLVPLFALFLLWRRRDWPAEGAARPSWWGLPLLVAGLALRLAGAYYYFPWLNAVALLPCVAGLFVLAGGWAALRWSWPAIAFLVFMLPLPYRLEVALALPLQGIATAASTYALQTLGFSAFAEGNVIRMGQVRIGVVEACNGLSMLVVFFALSTAVTLLTSRPWPDRAVIVLSAVPIALVANVVRITATGVLHKTAGREAAELVFHDLAGWLMMPLALALLAAELRVLRWVLPPAAAEDRAPLAAVGLFLEPPVPARRPVPAVSGQ